MSNPLQQMREALGLSKQELAERLGLSTRTVTRHEAGQAPNWLLWAVYGIKCWKEQSNEDRDKSV